MDELTSVFVLGMIGLLIIAVYVIVRSSGKKDKEDINIGSKTNKVIIFLSWMIGIIALFVLIFVFIFWFGLASGL